MHYHKSILIILAVVSITVILLGAGCAGPSAQVVPYVPPQYWNSMEVTPGDIKLAYEGRYGDFYEPNAIFKGQSIVFKNIELTNEMLEYVDKGYMYVEGVKLEFDNPEEWSQLRSGSKVDVAGFCKGLEMGAEIILLTLTESIYVPAGVVDLSGGDGDLIIPVY
jgi:hypothetical protein